MLYASGKHHGFGKLCRKVRTAGEASAGLTAGMAEGTSKFSATAPV